MLAQIIIMKKVKGPSRRFGPDEPFLILY